MHTDKNRIKEDKKQTFQINLPRLTNKNYQKFSFAFILLLSSSICVHLWQKKYMKYEKVKNYYNGSFHESSSSESLDIVSPIDGNLLSKVPMSTTDELNKAVESAKNAFDSWSKTPIKERVQVFFRYRYLLEKNLDELTKLVSEENGKTYDEAKAEVEKSVELTEFACSMPQLVSGEILEVSRGVECRTEHFPIGVVASIVPFNFPLMVPNWTMPNALVLGNTMVMKPSELVPLSVVKMAELLKEAGLPDGVFNVINGGREIVEGLCAHKDIEAVSFVGSTKVAKLVYQQSTHNLKRCIALGGAKNHLFVLPDANPQMTATNVTASMSGCAGQRCMAASAMIAVGNVNPIIEQICVEARKVIPGENLGAVISKAAKERI